MRRAGFTRLALAAAVGSGLLITMPARAGSNTRQTTLCDVAGTGFDADSVTLEGPAIIAPANHQMVDYTLTAKETDAEQTENPQPVVYLHYTVQSSDPGSAGASPAEASDSHGYLVTLPFQLRAETSGANASRTYVIDWDAKFDNGIHPCSGSFTVTVQHDNGH